MFTRSDFELALSADCELQMFQVPRPSELAGKVAGKRGTWRPATEAHSADHWRVDWSCVQPTLAEASLRKCTLGGS